MISAVNFNLSDPEFRLLCVLEQEGPMFLSELMDKTGKGIATTHRLVNQLSDKGYLTKTKRSGNANWLEVKTQN